MRVAHVVLSASVLAVPVALLSTLISARCAAPIAAPRTAAPPVAAPQAAAPPAPAPQATGPRTGAVDSAPAPPAASGEEDAVRLAVFRYLVGHNASGGQSHVPFVCLEVHQGEGAQDPSPVIMAAMRGTTPRVVPGTACEHSSDGVFLKRNHARGRGLVFRTAEVKIDGDRATVDGGYFEAGLSASGNVYTVERQGDGSWRVTKDEMKWIS
jgi:hypothetical protein